MNGINKGTIHVAFNAFGPAIEDAQAVMKPRDDFYLSLIIPLFWCGEEFD